MQTNHGIDYATKTGGNGGVNYLAQRKTKQLWANPDPVPRTTPCLVAAGKVIPAYTWLQRNSDGTVQPHAGFVWSQTVSIAAPLAANDTILFANSSTTLSHSITFTKKQTVAEAVDIIVNDVGFITALTLKGMSIAKTSDVTFIISLIDYDATMSAGTTATLNGSVDIPVAAFLNGTTGQSSSPASLLNVAGLLVYDVVAKNEAGTSVATAAQMFVSGSLYEEGVRWANTASETLTDPWGNTHAVTAYNTGCANIIARNAFLQNTDFEIRMTREAM
jgi:hypothetical protein